MNIILCGLPGCGKSTLGKKIAPLYQFDFIDTDLSIEELYKAKTGREFLVREIYKKEGVRFFRQLEKQVIASLLPKKGV